MTFVLYPLSHYNSIMESRARFLLSLLEHLTIDFPSHFILSLIDVFQDSASRDKLIFPSTITRILRHFSVPSPASDPFTFMCAIDAVTIKRSEAQLSRDSRILHLPLVRLHLVLLNPYPLPLLLQVMCHWKTSWCSFSAWILT